MEDGGGNCIPMDIVEEIMCYLPVKSLIRFRCVSKSWKSKISESRFIRKHLSRATLSQKRLVAVDYTTNNISGGFLCSLSITTSDQPLSFTKITSPMPDIPRALRAFCDELWLAEKSIFETYMWNPSTRTYRKLPENNNLKWRVIDGRCHPWSGVGYDSAGDDYKVMVAPARNGGGDGDGPETWLYSLRSDAWRKIDEGFPPVKFREYPPSVAGKYLNGKLHWIVYPFDSRMLDFVIVSFDLSTDKYGELPRPPNSPTSCADGQDNVGVTVLKGMLCVFLSYMDSPPQRLVLWIMNDYGVGESWTKLYEIHYSTFPSFFTLEDDDEEADTFLPVPLYLYENGDLLIHIFYSYKILIYKHGRATVRTIVLPRHTKFIDAFIYVESLVSPPITYSSDAD